MVFAQFWQWLSDRLNDYVATQVAATAQAIEPAAVSRDGSRVAVVVRRDGKRRLGIMALDGSDSRTLAPSIDLVGKI